MTGERGGRGPLGAPEAVGDPSPADPRDEGTVAHGPVRLVGDSGAAYVLADGPPASGGEALVYRALAEDDDAVVAVRVELVPGTLATQTALWERLAADPVAGPVVTPVWDHGHWDDRHFQVLDWLPRSLVGWASDQPSERRRAAARALVDAVRRLHAAGAAHGDLKPHNVLLREDDPGSLLLADIRPPGVSGFTAGWSPPEQRRGEGGSVAADRFALAATIWAVMAGAPPEGIAIGSGPAVTGADRARWDQAVGDAPLRRCLESYLIDDPSGRPPLDDLDRALAAAPPPALAELPVTPVAEAAPVAELPVTTVAEAAPVAELPVTSVAEATTVAGPRAQVAVAAPAALAGLTILLAGLVVLWPADLPQCPAGFAPVDSAPTRGAPARGEPLSRQPAAASADRGPGGALTCAHPDGREVVRVAPGRFVMGRTPTDDPERMPDADPHEVELTHPFWLGTTEVTQARWRAVVGTDPPAEREQVFDGGVVAPCDTWHGHGLLGDELPVMCVSFLDVVEWLAALSRLDGLRPAYVVEAGADGPHVRWDRTADGWRLPTEAEWEWAAVAGGEPDDVCVRANLRDQSAPEHWGNESPCDDGDPVLAPVGRRPPNRLGLHDMEGNVLEWVWDRYGPYPAGPVVDPVGPSSGPARVARGASWNHVPRGIRARYAGSPDGHSYSLGFRIARDAR